MSQESYDENYFSWYTQKGRITGRQYGDNPAYRYWVSFLRKRVPRDAKILEVGCGVGFFGRRAQQHFDYQGVDISDEALSWARQHHGLKNVQKVDAQKSLPFESSFFDAVVAFDVIEHLTEPDVFFAEVARILKSGGYFIATTPNIQSLGVRLKKQSTALTPSMYKDRTHVSLLPRDEWLSAMSRAGLHPVRTGTDTLWDIPYVTFLSPRLQQLALLPLNFLAGRLFVMLPWSLGENLVLIAQRNGANS